MVKGSDTVDSKTAKKTKQCRKMGGGVDGRKGTKRKAAKRRDRMTQRVNFMEKAPGKDGVAKHDQKIAET